MEKMKIKVGILPNQFLKENGISGKDIPSDVVEKFKE